MLSLTPRELAMVCFDGKQLAVSRSAHFAARSAYSFTPLALAPVISHKGTIAHGPVSDLTPAIAVLFRPEPGTTKAPSARSRFQLFGLPWALRALPAKKLPRPRQPERNDRVTLVSLLETQTPGDSRAGQSRAIIRRMNEDRLLDEVVRILRACGLNAGISDTGGGILCIAVASPDGDLSEPRFMFGTAAEKWAAEVEDEPAGLVTSVSSTASDPRAIAFGVLEAIARFARSST